MNGATNDRSLGRCQDVRYESDVNLLGTAGKLIDGRRWAALSSEATGP